MAMTPRVMDMYSLTRTQPDSFKKAKAAGLWGCIHKASEGSTWHDPKYRDRRAMAAEAGLLWGAYHFNLGDDYKTQAKNFITSAEPDEDTLLVLDFEDYVRGNMSVHNAVKFMKMVEDMCGRECAIYSGNRLKETISELSKSDFEYITSKRLWLCQYGPKPVVPKGFKKYWLWQYTGDGIGPLPHQIDGFNPGEDLNVYDGSFEQLKKEWSA